MPIYAYKCSACGFAKDVLRKMSDAPLTECPHCGASAFEKQVTAAGFQLKGSGWYVTDFREGAGKKAAESKGEGAPAADAKPAPDNGAAAPAPAAAAAPAASPASAAPAPAASSTPSAKTD